MPSSVPVHGPRPARRLRAALPGRSRRCRAGGRRAGLDVSDRSAGRTQVEVVGTSVLTPMQVEEAAASQCDPAGPVRRGRGPRRVQALPAVDGPPSPAAGRPRSPSRWWSVRLWPRSPRPRQASRDRARAWAYRTVTRSRPGCRWPTGLTRPADVKHPRRADRAGVPHRELREQLVSVSVTAPARSDCAALRPYGDLGDDSASATKAQGTTALLRRRATRSTSARRPGDHTISDKGLQTEHGGRVTAESDSRHVSGRRHAAQSWLTLVVRIRCRPEVQ